MTERHRRKCGCLFEIDGAHVYLTMCAEHAGTDCKGRTITTMDDPLACMAQTDDAIFWIEQDGQTQE